MFAHPRRWQIVSSALLVVLSAACVQMAPPSLPLPGARTPARDQVSTTANTTEASVANTQTPNAQLEVQATQAPTAAPTTIARTTSNSSQKAAASPTPRPFKDSQLVAVKRGPIDNVAQLSGVVAATQDAPVSFSIGGKLDSVAVQAGQPVRGGQKLASIDTTDALAALSDAQAAVQIDTLKLEQLQASATAAAQAQQQQRAQGALRQQAADDAANRQTAQAMAQAQEQLRQAQANLEKVKAGASAIDRLGAQAAVVTAQAADDKAQADLARLQAGPTQAEVLAAQSDVNTATAAARKADADRQKLLAPPDPATVATARAAVAQAQANLEAAGTQPSSAPGAPKISDTERQRLKEAAKYAVDSAQAQLSALLKGPDQASIDAANSAVEGAKNQLAIAQAKLDQVKAGPSADQISAARSAGQSTQLALQAAQAHADEVKSHPTQAELADAQRAVDQAQAALDQASQPPATNAGSDSTSTSTTAANQPADFAVQQAQLQHALDKDRAQVATLQRQIEASQLTAPFTGIVESVQVRAGDTIQAQQQIAIIASADEPVATVSLPSNSTGAPSVGDQVRVQYNGTVLSGTISALPGAANTDDNTARIAVDWHGTAPAIGSTVLVSLSLQHKDQAILVPSKAIRTSGTRKSVQLLDGNQPKTIEVTVGLAANDQTEILTGVSEGQIVILPN